MSPATKVTIALVVLFAALLGIYYGFAGPAGRPPRVQEGLTGQDADDTASTGTIQPELPAAPAGLLGDPVARALAGPWLAPAGPEPPSTEPSAEVRPVQESPAVAPPRAAAGQAPDEGPARAEYVVRSDDSLWTVAAEQLGDASRWAEIAMANPGIDPDRLRPGQRIRLPARRGSRSLPGPEPPIAPRAGAAAAPLTQYTVRDGDTLTTIAQRHYGSSAQWQKIYEANRDVIGADPDRLRVGMKLRIP
jgi:nucleoid-associated protein YgaU